MLAVRLNFKGKSPLAAMTCESTQPTLNTTVQYGTFVLEFIQQEFVQSFAETIARKSCKLHSQEHCVISWHV